jgi:UDP-N-acetylmuramoyl-L-alanyl-D-glutamate--2,6-diaminopimelate ligase
MLEKLIEQHGGACVLERPGAEVRGVSLDSRRVEAGDLFVALAGAESDGRRYVAQALERGASAVLLEESPDSALLDLAARSASGVPLWVHPAARSVAGMVAAELRGRPSKGMHVVAITGTNGKTTTAHLTGQLLAACDFRPAVLGTAGHTLADGVVRPAMHTTPDAPLLQQLLAEHRSLGGDSVVLEASSHALVQERLAGLDVTCAVFTNLTRDHLDYHGDMQQYARAKARLFAGLADNAVAILNADDAYAHVMRDAAAQSGARVITYSSQSPADLRASLSRTDLDVTYLTLSGMGISLDRLRVNLLGRFNIENALAASAAVLMSGASPSAIVEGLATVSPPPGRLERVSTGDRGFHVFVDYAHTEDALRNALGVLRDAMTPGQGRLIVVFGCGGDRDRGKRAPMGRAASELADSVVITSDNPRREAPQQIIDEIRAGISGGAQVHVESDRRLAISHALAGARAGDVVLIAGKGHEGLQLVGAESIEFDDRVVAREELA